MDGVQSGKIDLTTIHCINGVFADWHLVEHFDIGNLGGCDRDIRWDRAPQVNERVHLYPSFCFAKFGPWKQRQTQIDHGGIKGKEWLLQISGDSLIPVKTLSYTDKNVAKVLKDSVIATFIGIGESRPGNRATKTDVIEFVSMGIETGFNVTQTLTSRHLSVSQTEELIESGESLYPVLSSIPANAKIEVVPGEKLEQLPENGLAGIHGHPPKGYWKGTTGRN